MSDATLVALLAAGRAPWPGLAVEDETFFAYVRERSEGGEPPPIANAADLFLACACTHGVDGAAAAFERMFRPVLERAIARVNRASVDEGTQIVLVSLLVTTPEGRPRIAGYSGRSSLKTWLAIVATRTTLKLHRRLDDQGHESLEGLAASFLADEPELALAKAQHGPELATSLRTAVAALEPRQLVLLRLHYAEGWSIDRLGPLYRVGRSTAARWIAAARDQLVDTAKRDLRERLRLTPSELESLVVLLQSNIQLSLLRLLGEDGDDGDERKGSVEQR